MTGLRLPFKVLLFTSYFFLLFPWVIFAFGWLKWPYAMGVCAGLFWGARELVRQTNKRVRLDDAHAVPDKTLLPVLLFALLWATLSGAGGFGLQNFDWIKHNAILKELVTHPWPVKFYLPSGEPAALVYYLAYYLPAGLVGRALGWELANWTLFFTSFVGFSLASIWFVRLVKRPAWWVVVVFGLFSGLDFIGFSIMNSQIPSGIEHIEWWAHFWQYPSHATQFFWAPQHALPGWIAAALILHDVQTHQTSENLFLLLCGVLLWSPFVAVGLIPLVAYAVFSNRFSTVFSVQNCIAAPVVALVAVLYFSAHNQNLPKHFILNFGNLPSLWPHYLLFCVLEFGLFFWFLKDWRFEEGTNGWAWVSLLALTVLPIYRIGLYNDFAMRASNPSLFVLSVLIAQNLVSNHGRIKNPSLFVLLLLGTLTGLFETGRSLSYRANRMPDPQKTLSFRQSEMLVGTNQYNGDLKGLFFRTFVKQRKIVDLEGR
jgi:hypothetical protein